jgi:orotidine-5'-phosphate decarboxylase
MLCGHGTGLTRTGNTVSLQYSAGVFKIASWSHITNAHPVPGPSVIQGLSSVGLPLGRGLLLLAEMSTKGSLAVGSYTESAIQMARENPDFVIGFIAQNRIEDNEHDFLVLTPGVAIDVAGDGMGQQYRSPRQVVFEAGCDVIIVGRGIYGKDFTAVEAIAERARHYQEQGWSSYLERIKGEQ